MSLSLSGIIYFAPELTHDALIDVSFFIAKEALKRRLGVLLGCNMPPHFSRKFVDLDHMNFAVEMPFNIAESALYPNCDTLFEPIYINFSDPANVTADVSESALPRIQQFFEAIMERAEISRIRLDFETFYALPEEFARYECRPNQICETFERELARTKSWDAPIQITMDKNK